MHLPKMMVGSLCLVFLTLPFLPLFSGPMVDAIPPTKVANSGVEPANDVSFKDSVVRPEVPQETPKGSAQGALKEPEKPSIPNPVIAEIHPLEPGPGCVRLATPIPAHPDPSADLGDLSLQPVPLPRLPDLPGNHESPGSKPIAVPKITRIPLEPGQSLELPPLASPGRRGDEGSQIEIEHYAKLHKELAQFLTDEQLRQAIAEVSERITQKRIERERTIKEKAAQASLEKAKSAIRQIAQSFPDTEAAKEANRILGSLENPGELFLLAPPSIPNPPGIPKAPSPASKKK